MKYYYYSSIFIDYLIIIIFRKIYVNHRFFLLETVLDTIITGTKKDVDKSQRLFCIYINYSATVVVSVVVSAVVVSVVEADSSTVVSSVVVVAASFTRPST